LLGLGFSTINPKKLSFAKAFTTVLVVWIFYVAVKVGVTAIFT
jgi:hypothetical protein